MVPIEPDEKLFEKWNDFFCFNLTKKNMLPIETKRSKWLRNLNLACIYTIWLLTVTSWVTTLLFFGNSQLQTCLARCWCHWKSPSKKCRIRENAVTNEMNGIIPTFTSFLSPIQPFITLGQIDSGIIQVSLTDFESSLGNCIDDTSELVRSQVAFSHQIVFIDLFKLANCLACLCHMEFIDLF